jgi:hypothetical protein
MMQFYQLPQSIPSFEDSTFIVKHFNPMKAIQHIPLYEVYQSESSSKSTSDETSEISFSSTGSADVNCITIDPKKPQRWSRVDVKLMHTDVKKFLKNSGNPKMLMEKKKNPRGFFKAVFEELAMYDPEYIKKSLMMLVEPKM